MGLTDTPASERKHIAFFGLRNAGKSSLINRFSGQEMSIVSDTPGTTTDPVRKTMELLPLGPVVLIDTPGLDDEGELGKKRIERTRAILRETDIAILVVDAIKGISRFDKEIEEVLNEQKIPYIIAINKTDKLEDIDVDSKNNTSIMYVSSLKGEGINELKERVAGLLKDEISHKVIVSDLLDQGDIAVLVIPIDESAPKGRLILPQQLVIRDLLDQGMCPVCTQPNQLTEVLGALRDDPAIVVTDSQVFEDVSRIVPKRIRLTSFSMLMARYKGTLKQSLEGANFLDQIRDGDKILISEGCTHHRQCNDIGTVKLPGWICEYKKASPVFEFTSGRDFLDDLSEYKLIIHCGGCMLNEKEMSGRYAIAAKKNIPMTNYGTAIAKMRGILDRVDFLASF